MKKLDLAFISKFILPLILVLVVVLVAKLLNSETKQVSQAFNLMYEIRVLVFSLPVLAFIYIAYRYLEALKDRRTVYIMDIKKHYPALNNHEAIKMHGKESRMMNRLDVIAFIILFIGLCLLFSFV